MRRRPITHLPAYLLDIAEVARWLRLEISTVRKWVCYNKIPYLHVGRRVAFDPRLIELWLEKTNPQLKKWKKLLRRDG